MKRQLTPNEFFVLHTSSNGFHLNPSTQRFVMDDLIQHINEHPEIEKLTLSKCGLNDNNIISLTDMLKNNQSISELDLSRNKFKLIGANAIVSMLEVNKTITALIVSRNRFSDEGIGAFAKMMESNSTLTSININFCNDCPVNRDLSKTQNHILAKINKELNKNKRWKEIFPQYFADQVIALCQGVRQQRILIIKDILVNHILTSCSFNIPVDLVVKMCNFIYENLVEKQSTKPTFFNNPVTAAKKPDELLNKSDVDRDIFVNKFIKQKKLM